MTPLPQFDLRCSAGRKLVEPSIEDCGWWIQRQLTAVEPDAATAAGARVERHASERGLTQLAATRWAG